MKSNSRFVVPNCPKCQSQDTTKNGTAPSKEGRVQRLRCNACKHIWNDSTFAIKSQKTSRAVSEQAPPRSTGSRKQRTSIPPKAASELEFHSTSSTIAHHRKIELEIPLDWSQAGLLKFAQAAQQELLQASLSFGHSAQAELEWNALNPALKTYIKAKHHLDFALLLHLQAVFTALEAPNLFQPLEQVHFLREQPQFPSLQREPNALNQDQPDFARSRTSKQKTGKLKKQSPTKLEIPRKSSHRKNSKPLVKPQVETNLETESSSTSENVSSRAHTTDDPDRHQFLELFDVFQEERQQWTHEQTLLQKSVRELEQTQSQNALRLISVTHEFERLKKQVLEPKLSPKIEAPFKPTRESQLPTPTVTPTSSSNGRTMPPKYSTRETANLERLASSLMANLVRLDGYRIPTRDLVHVTGEKGAWKTVIEHLLTLGKIEHQGEFIAISLVERLRRGLQPSGMKPSAN